LIHLVCALDCEARPLIARYHLARVAEARPFRMYITADHRMTLTLTGPGKRNAARAVEATRMFFDAGRSDGWLNVGVAGHGRLDVGQAALAHYILDATTQQVWYPQTVFTPPCPRAGVKTLAGPSRAYENTCYDMEAAGFYASAIRCSTAELVHSLKIISDNPRHPAVTLRPAFVEHLVKGQIGCIEKIIAEIISLSDELSTIQGPPGFYDECMERWHFTHCERHLLADLLRRWQAACPDRHPLERAVGIRQGSDLLRLLAQALQEAPVKLSKAEA